MGHKEPEITPARIAVLLEVHREGGVVAAADSLKISPSAVSQAIAKLERETGMKMLERTPFGAVVTPAGRILIKLGEQIEFHISDAKTQLREVTGQITGTITIGGFHTVILSALIPFLSHMSRISPGIDVQIKEFAESSGFPALRAGKIDMLILERDTESTRPPSGFVDAPLFDEPWLIVSPVGTPQPSKIADLVHHSWLMANEGTASAFATRRLLDALDNPTSAGHSYLDYSVALAMVSAGFGSAVLPQLALLSGVPDDVVITRVPGLGVRRLLLRYKQKDFERVRALRQTIEQLRKFMADDASSWRLEKTTSETTSRVR